jgi:hypothetical protein
MGFDDSRGLPARRWRRRGIGRAIHSRKQGRAMTRYERVRYEKLLRVRDFGKTHAAIFSESSSGQQALATVARVIEEIDALTTARLIAAEDSGKAKAARRKVILDRMQAIVRTSRRVTESSGSRMRLRMPRQIADVAVASAARRFLTTAEAHHDQFVRLGLPATCLTELREVLATFEAAMEDRRIGRQGVASAKADIKVALATGADAASELDVIVRNAAANDAGVLAAWERDVRIVDWLRRRNGTAAAAASVTPASSTAPPPTPEQEVASLRKVS